MTKQHSLYTLSKSREILLSRYKWYKNHGGNLSQDERDKLETEMSALDKALLDKNRVLADQISHILESYGNICIKKRILNRSLQLFFSITIALIIALSVRQMWFELYEIPTGSMRPTFREQDHLTVTKTAFGINVPLKTEHFYFDPDLVKRSSIVIFSGENLPFLHDTKSTYFGIIPYSKRYVKRLMGKPGDTIYFYGGKIYSLDRAGNLNYDLLNAPWLEKIEHIPYINFEGEQTVTRSNHILIHQMGQPIGKLFLNNLGQWTGEIFNGSAWVKDNQTRSSHQQIETLSDFWGIGNYAMARLLTGKELQQYPNSNISEIESGILYLELKHHPSLSYLAQVSLRYMGKKAMLNPLTTIIPLQQTHLDVIMDNIYTARFVVSNGRGALYNESHPNFSNESPLFPNLQDGTYEFYHGKAYQIKWGGINFALPSDHPIYNRDSENIQKLFNFGIDMNMAYSPHPSNQLLFPHRYAYFREGELYLLGAPILRQDDPILVAFNERESKKEKDAITGRPYIAFQDKGSPIKNGQIDKEMIKKFGLKIPEGHYLTLGDNHAMSADTRVFGFVPETNLQGAPSLIIWPPGDRLGSLPQKPYALFSLSRLIIWSCAFVIIIMYYTISRRRLRKPIFRKIDFSLRSPKIKNNNSY